MWDSYSFSRDLSWESTGSKYGIEGDSTITSFQEFFITGTNVVGIFLIPGLGNSFLTISFISPVHQLFLPGFYTFWCFLIELELLKHQWRILVKFYKKTFKEYKKCFEHFSLNCYKTVGLPQTVLPFYMDAA